MLLDISTWWQGLVLFEKILWSIALISSLLFLLQTLLSIAGGHGDVHDAMGDSDASIYADNGMAHQFFTLKNVIAFLTMFGWVGLAAFHNEASQTGTIILGAVGGIIMVLMMVFLLRQTGRLKYSGTMDIRNALRQSAETYLVIPGRRTGLGKVHIRIQGALRELQAMTDDEENIPTGKMVRVTGVIGDQILLVTGLP